MQCKGNDTTYQSLINKTLNFHLPLTFKLKVFLLRVNWLLVDSLPAGILFKFSPTGLFQELVVPVTFCVRNCNAHLKMHTEHLRYEIIPVDICFIENMLSHPLHLFVTLSHVVLRSMGVVYFVQFLGKQSLHFILIPNAISVQI